MFTQLTALFDLGSAHTTAKGAALVPPDEAFSRVFSALGQADQERGRDRSADAPERETDAKQVDTVEQVMSDDGPVGGRDTRDDTPVVSGEESDPVMSVEGRFDSGADRLPSRDIAVFANVARTTASDHSWTAVPPGFASGSGPKTGHAEKDAIPGRRALIAASGALPGFRRQGVETPEMQRPPVPLRRVTSTVDRVARMEQQGARSLPIFQARTELGVQAMARAGGLHSAVASDGAGPEDHVKTADPQAQLSLNRPVSTEAQPGGSPHVASASLTTKPATEAVATTVPPGRGLAGSERRVAPGGTQLEGSPHGPPSSSAMKPTTESVAAKVAPHPGLTATETDHRAPVARRAEVAEPLQDKHALQKTTDEPDPRVLSEPLRPEIAPKNEGRGPESPDKGALSASQAPDFVMQSEDVTAPAAIEGDDTTLPADQSGKALHADAQHQIALVGHSGLSIERPSQILAFSEKTPPSASYEVAEGLAQGGERAVGSPIPGRGPDDVSDARLVRIIPGTSRNAGGPQPTRESLNHEQAVFVVRKPRTEPARAGDPDPLAQTMAKADRASLSDSRVAGLAMESGQAQRHDSSGLSGSGVKPAHDGTANQRETPGTMAADRLDTAPIRKGSAPGPLGVAAAARRPVSAPSPATGFDDPLGRSSDNAPPVVHRTGIAASQRVNPGKDVPPASTVAAIAKAGVQPATRGPGPMIGQPVAKSGGGVPDLAGVAPGREPSAQADHGVIAESTRGPIHALSAHRAENLPFARGQVTPADRQGRAPSVEERIVVVPSAKQETDPWVWRRRPGSNVALCQPTTQNTPHMQRPQPAPPGQTMREAGREGRTLSEPEARTTAPAAQAATRSSGPGGRMLAPAGLDESNAPLRGTTFVTSPFLADLDEPRLSGDIGEMGPAEARGSIGGPHQTVSMPGGPLRPEPAAILRQVADALPRAADGRIDVQLNPEELGRVRFQIHPGENGLVVQVAADRPETLDLMRRHLDQLARDFAEAGYEGASFSFGGDASDNQGDTSGSRLGSDGETQPGDAADVARAPQQKAPSEGLDIRI